MNSAVTHINTRAHKDTYRHTHTDTHAHTCVYCGLVGDSRSDWGGGETGNLSPGRRRRRRRRRV